MRALAILMLLTACNSPTSPARLSDFTFDFGIQRSAAEASFAISASDRAIVLRGSYEALTTGYTATAVAAATDGVVEIRITGKQPVANYPAIVMTGYEIAVRGIRSGRTHVRVLHEWAGANRASQLVFETDVLVP